MNIGDYIIFHDDTIDKKKNLLGKIEKLNPLLVRLQPNAFGELHSVEVPQNAILCSVGQKPKVGSVYGVDLTNVYRKSVEIEKFGRLLFNGQIRIHAAPQEQGVLCQRGNGRFARGL